MQRLTKNQKITQRKLRSKIKDAKRRARGKSNYVPHKYIKHATEELLKLYSTPEFKDNQKFLLSRYSKLERKAPIWSSLVIPVVLSILSFEGLERLYPDTENFVQAISLVISVIPTADQTMQVKLILVLGLSFALVALFIWSVYLLCKTIIDSLTRNASTTIIENEMYILRSLLVQHGIILDDHKEYVAISAHSSSKKATQKNNPSV